MLFSHTRAIVAAGFALAAPLLMAEPAQAVPMVTYSWTTTSEGFGFQVHEPTSATFEVPLSDVVNGVIFQSDITDIQLTYPGLTFDSAVTSSDGFDFSAFVDPTTGAFIYHDPGQGLGVIAFAGTDINSAITFLSITVDNVASTPSGQLLTSVADQFNALDNGGADAGFPTAGFWTASFPTVTGGGGGGVPEPAAWALMILGFGGIGAVLRQRRRGLAAA
jgi:hypothetical protein